MISKIISKIKNYFKQEDYQLIGYIPKDFKSCRTEVKEDGEIIMTITNRFKKTMELRHSLKNIIEVDYADLQEFIIKAFNISSATRYRLVAENEWSNDSCYPVTVKNFTELDEWDQEAVRDLIETNTVTGYGINIVLNALYEKKLILPGEYIINVCW